MYGKTTQNAISSQDASIKHPSKHIVVQKFGGTSLSTDSARQKAIEHIQNSKNSGFATVVVVSAIGRYPQPYATDTLIQLMSQISPSPSQTFQDLLLSCGEVISACIMGQLLENAGFSAAVLPWHSLGIVTDASFGDASPKLADVTRIREELLNGKIVVLPGFQGNTEIGDITTLGRGGSDLTAVVLGAALGAQTVEIFTDVDGIKTADPNILPEAVTLSEVTYEELEELAFHGAKVVHSKAVSMATAEQVPLSIRATKSNKPGTRVVHKLSTAGQIVTGIAHAAPLAFVKIKLPKQEPCQAAKQILDSFAKEQISLDMIHISIEHLYFIFKEEFMTKGRAILKSSNCATSMEGGYAKVSIVGAGMRGVPGIMARIVDALHEAKIPLYHSTDSHITISCLVPQSDLKGSIATLSKKFNLTGKHHVE